MHAQKTLLHLNYPCVMLGNFVRNQNLKPNPHHVLDPRLVQAGMDGEYGAGSLVQQDGGLQQPAGAGNRVRSSTMNPAVPSFSQLV